MSVDLSQFRMWRNRQTHNVEGVDLRVYVGSSPTIRTDEMEMDVNDNKEQACSFSFVKDGITVPCIRKPVIELDGRQFCKLHGEVYVLENFDVKKSNLHDPDTEHK